MNEPTERKLSDLHAGDEVAVLHYTGEVTGIRKIERVTQTGLYRVGGTYFKPNGVERREKGFVRDYIEPVTDKHRRELKAAILRRQIRSVSWREQSLDKLLRIWQIIQE